ncbi:ADP-ribosylglycohydrolase family protein [Aromatoleum anaerobium]|uniref:ADP-ribosylglycohydrolase family protein n=1 Tax=Aromatoleum anaerobium TaxID=182180 RepID=A0ABX1PRA8_9RHOO|nr:ADP-ribosylglycohydrolase family protein [Aromatoleum anaerobium]MCK0508561.1 ADP-ribosylglycohydrolase family protein [Aromatoleum anaerobium]
MFRAPEFDNYRAKDFSPVFHHRAKFTDDIVCTIAVADALVNERDPAVAFKDWGRRYWDNGGWGQRFALWLASEEMGPYGSYGAAMRVAPAGLLATSVDHAIELARAVTRVTHDHPEGLKGAEATALAIFLAKRRVTPHNIKVAITERFGYDLERTVDEIRRTYRFNETCQETVPQAFVCALDAKDFEDAIRNAISIGGDSDTVAAIAGGVAEALFGIPDDIADAGWCYLTHEMREVLTRLYREVGELV